MVDSKQEQGPASRIFAPRRYSETLLERIHYWTPPVPGVRPLREQPRTSLRVAAVVDERLFRGFHFEVDLLLLTPGNWRQILRHQEIDFLLVESCWQTVTGHWYLGQSFNQQHQEELLAILEFARKQSIPTVYWITWDHLYHTHFSGFAAAFDHVFCADLHEVDLLRHEGISAHYLPPAVQPAIHNRVKEEIPGLEEFSVNVLFDGFTDIERLGDQLAILEDLRPYGLCIVESQSKVFTSRIPDTSLMQECFLGCVSYNDWLTTAKHTKSAIYFDKTIRTITQQQWIQMETASCGVSVIHFGEFQNEDIRKNCILNSNDETDIIITVESFYQDNLYRKRYANKLENIISNNHTFLNRINTILSILGKTNTEYNKSCIMYINIESGTLTDMLHLDTYLN